MPLLVSFSYPLTIPSDLTLSLPPHPLTLRSLSSPSSSHPQISLFVLIPVPILSHPPSSSFSLFPLSSHPPSLILFISSSLSPHAVSSSPYCRRRRPSSPTLSRRRRDASPSDLPVIKDVLEISAVLNSKWKRQQELIYITTYDLLFGKEFSSFGTAEKYLFQRKAALDSALEKVLVKKKEKRVEDLLSQYETPALYLTNLKLDVDSAFNELAKVKKDDLVPDLLLLPPGVDLHDHPLVKNGSVFLQGKGSSMVAVALGPQPGWQVLDACSAPGNKTVHLAALMKGKGKILACELNADRVKLLQNTIKVAGAKNVEVHHGDFLKLDPEDPTYSKLRAILLDPSCSGSGTAVERLDHLLPSNMNNEAGASDIIRLTKLAGFQKKALEHALSFPSVERIVYSTCSIHQTENEDVVKSVLPMALKNGFELATPFPEWPRRGLPVFKGSERVLRMDPDEDKAGFFIALFVRKNMHEDHNLCNEGGCDANQFKKRKREMPLPFTRLSKIWLLSLMSSSSSHCCSSC